MTDPGAPLAGGDDTIAALASAPGRGALAVVRMSGAGAFDVAARVLEPWPIGDRAPRLCALRHPASGALVDRAVATAYEAPRSYTGERMVELTTHGGLLVPAAALDALLAAGARPALPGEFTRRAVLNGKLDVVRAEAVGDLVDARSGAMHRSALAQLDGGLSRRVGELRDALLEVEALIAYEIDFPEEDDGPVPPARVREACDAALAALDTLLATAPAGELVREGALVVLAGAPNVGKSSLFNALIGRARAIVTDIPGTTRDALEAVVDGGAWPLRLVDTAGLRASDDVVERLGIEVSERYLADAHVVLACGDDASSLRDAVRLASAARGTAAAGAPVIAVRTKSDLVPATELHAAGTGVDGAATVVPVSAERGTGLRELLDAIAAVLASRHGPPEPEVPMLTRERHRRAIARALEELAQFRAAWLEAGLPPPVAAVHLRAAVGALEELIGAVDVEDVLDRVFASFCVGK